MLTYTYLITNEFCYASSIASPCNIKNEEAMHLQDSAGFSPLNIYDFMLCYYVGLVTNIIRCG